MGIDYTLIAGILLYFTVVKLMANTQLKPVTAAAIVVLGYFILTTIVKAILFSIYGIDFWQVVFDPIRIASVALQFSAAFLIFRQMQENGEESYGFWFGWAIAGGIIIFFLAPYVASRLVGIT